MARFYVKFEGLNIENVLDDEEKSLVFDAQAAEADAYVANSRQNFAFHIVANYHRERVSIVQFYV